MMRKRNFDKNIENVRNIARAFQNDIFLTQQEALNNSLQLKTKRLLNKKRSITEINYRTNNALQRIAYKTFKIHQYKLFETIEITTNEILPFLITQTFEEFTDIKNI